MAHGSVKSFPLRIWIVDNSGSMASGDGQVLKRSGAVQKMQSCTRWEELCATCERIGDLATRLGARTDFHLLNRVSDGKHLSIASGAGAAHIEPLGPPGDTQALKELLSTSPRGTTPLTEALQEVIAMIAPQADKLRAHGEEVVVVIATDGLPNRPDDFTQAVRELQRLPVWLIVRLCTNTESTTQYWAELDSVLEAPLEVLDDHGGEADEVMKFNPWLNYAAPLHLVREFGVREKLFDLLDEQRLLPSQIKALCEKMLGVAADGKALDLPEPELEPQRFASELRAALAPLEPLFNVKSAKLMPFVNLKLLPKSAKGGGGCVIA